jgi:hypothetical protein
LFASNKTVFSGFENCLTHKVNATSNSCDYRPGGVGLAAEIPFDAASTYRSEALEQIDVAGL